MQRVFARGPGVVCLYVIAGLRAKTHWCRAPDEQPVHLLEARPEARWCENISAKRPTLDAEQVQNRAGAPHGGKNRLLDRLDDPPPWAEGGYRPGL